MKTIVFDFGNVVAFFDHQRAVQQLTHFTDLSPSELLRLLYNGQLEIDYERGKLSTAEYVREAKRVGRLTCSDEVFLAAFVDIFWPNDAVCPLIPQLAVRYRLLLASNTNAAHAQQFTGQFADILGYFAHLVTSPAAGARKPEPEFFSYAQSFAAADPSKCLFIDDLPANVASARQHGWAGIQYHPDLNLAEELQRFGIQVEGPGR